MLQRIVQRQLVTFTTQPADYADREVGEIRVVTEFFSGEYIGKMYFDKRYGDRGQRITERHAGMRKRGRIDDDEIHRITGCLLNTVDQVTFLIALKSYQRDTGRARAINQALVNRGKGNEAIMSRLASAQ